MLLKAIYICIFCIQLSAGQFHETSVEFHVKENSPFGTVIGDVSTASGGQIRPPFFLLDSSVPDSLDFDLDSGRITVIGNLDRETSSSFSLLALYAEEGNIVKIVIRITDENDNSPKFDPPSFNLTISESTPVPKCWPLPTARDADEGANGVVRCEMIEPNFNFEISYNHENSELNLCLKSELDFETFQNHSISILAIDGGGKSALLSVIVQIIDENDHVPIFEAPKYEFSFKRLGYHNGQAIAHLHAIDQDSGHNGEVKYSISSRLNSSFPFSIDENNGDIIVSNLPIPIGSFSFVVKAYDQGNPSLESEVPVFIRVL